jgi:hypothetical protein
MFNSRVRTRLGLALGAAVIGALLGGCNGSDSSGTASAADAAGGTASVADVADAPGDSIPDAGRPLRGLPPWGPSAGTGSSPGTGPSSGSAAAPGTVTISWAPPTENTNGSALTDLAGYTIHYGTNSQNYTSAIQVENPGITRYVVDNLPAGTYYFAVSAYSSTGENSAYSPQVSVTVD